MVDEFLRARVTLFAFHSFSPNERQVFAYFTFFIPFLLMIDKFLHTRVTLFTFYLFFFSNDRRAFVTLFAFHSFSPNKRRVFAHSCHAFHSFSLNDRQAVLVQIN